MPCGRVEVYEGSTHGFGNGSEGAAREAGEGEVERPNAEVGAANQCAATCGSANPERPCNFVRDAAAVRAAGARTHRSQKTYLTRCGWQVTSVAGRKRRPASL